MEWFIKTYSEDDFVITGESLSEALEQHGVNLDDKDLMSITRI